MSSNENAIEVMLWVVSLAKNHQIIESLSFTSKEYAKYAYSNPKDYFNLDTLTSCDEIILATEQQDVSSKPL